MADQVQLSQEQQQEIEKQILESKISLSLTVRSVNIILGLLGKYPFDEVANLVSEIQEDGQPQVRKLMSEIEARVTKAANDASVTDVKPVK